ncbi:MAG: thioredoxin family protein [Saprospiraceae bacterium]|nr:thioredoxin family protein [Saprospiraceae bacterium]
MTKSVYAFFFTLLSFTVFSQGIDFVEITWQEAIEKAKEENKLLFVDSYAKWCGPCKKMAKYEFVKPEVGEVYNSNFVNLKLDMESRNGRTFDSKYPVSAYPTMFFLDGDGNVVKKVKGGKKAEQLISMAKMVIKSYDTSGKYKEQYDGGDRSYDVVYKYVEALNKAGKPSLRISNKYLKSNPDITEEQKLKFYYVATVDADSKVFDKMVGQKDKIIKLVSEKKYNNKVKSACQKTVEKAIEFETVDLLTEAVEKAKKYMVKDAEVFVLECKLDYYSNIKDSKMYGEAAKSISKIYLKNEVEKMKGLILEMQSKFKKDEVLLEQSVDLAKKYYKKSTTQESTMLYAKSLLIVNKSGDAIKVLNKGIKEAKKDGKSTKSLEMMLKVVEEKKA